MTNSMTNRERVRPEKKGRTLIFPPDDFPVVVPFGAGIKIDECFFEVQGTGKSRVVLAALKNLPKTRIRIHPYYSEIERLTLRGKLTDVRFWIVVSDLDRLRARQLIEREHYLMPTARGLVLACGITERGAKSSSKIIGIAVLDTLLHGSPVAGRSQFAGRVLGNAAWVKWPRNKIVNRLRIAWASRFAVHSAYHGCGLGTRLACHLRTVARRFRLPVADFVEVITTEPRSIQREGGFLVEAGYNRMAEPLRSSPLRVLNLKTGYMEPVSARKYYYYADIRND